MKKLLLLLIVIFLTIRCSEEDNQTNLNPNDYSFAINEKQEFENELSLKIDNNIESLNFISNKKNNTSVLKSLVYSENNTTQFISTVNSALDTLIAYKKNTNTNITEGIRYIIKNKKEEIIQIIQIDISTKEIIVKNSYEFTILNPKTNKSSSKSEITKKDNLEVDVDNKIKFFGDPSETHPISKFFKDIGKGIKNGANDIYDSSEEKFKEISDKIKNSKFNDFFDKINQSGIKNKLNKAKDFIKNNSPEFIDNITKKINEIDFTELIPDNINIFKEKIDLSGKWRLYPQRVFCGLCTYRSYIFKEDGEIDFDSAGPVNYCPKFNYTYEINGDNLTIIGVYEYISRHNLSCTGSYFGDTKITVRNELILTKSNNYNTYIGTLKETETKSYENSCPDNIIERCSELEVSLERF
ncbi:hypothetical protein [Polaribacter aestuariivivens]|uniref:hypothetical protein n=1 Tax=Polaribacter aestuariivivens TaxID=2304626 RepID=UPI003F492EC3